MDAEQVRKHIGKKVILTLKNNFEYTCIIPSFFGTGFSFIDKYGKQIDIECDYIAFIREK